MYDNELTTRGIKIWTENKMKWKHVIFIAASAPERNSQKITLIYIK